ncbi:hypothetical protein KM043_016443 [Ampulex compressa]|nr:hypothetical protein KM043_016443 [Ampulex compressa]
MVKQGQEFSLFVEQTFADDTAGHWCLARSGPWYKSVRTTVGGFGEWEVEKRDLIPSPRMNSGGQITSPSFNEQLAGSRNGLNIRDEVELGSGVSKSSVRYVSTSPEGWIGRGNKMGARSRGLARLERERAVGGGSQWSAHLADPTSLTSLMIYVELQAP